MITVTRYPKNPVLRLNKNNLWEAEAAFNGCPVVDRGTTHLLYRALSSPQPYDGKVMPLSTIGISSSKDGVRFGRHRQLIVPEQYWEKFGCEDPRVTKLEGNFFIFYTALSTYPFTPDGIKIGVALSKDLRRIAEKHLVTPFNAKAMTLFPERINGKIAAILTVNTDRPPAFICLALFDREEDMWSREYWGEWYTALSNHVIPIPQSSRDHLEVGAPPLRIRDGWLFIYSHIRNYFSPPALFGIEAVLLDLKDPLKIIGKTSGPLLTPHEDYERYGLVPNIVFPSGALKRGKTLYLYYGAADTSCCAAMAPFSGLVREMKKEAARKPPELTRPFSRPLLEPDPSRSWESKAIFNAAAVYADKKIHIVYRAMSADNTSVMGYAVSKDGITISEKMTEPFYVPREPFEQKLVPNGNSGCEDPRLTRMGNTLFMCYTAYNGKEHPRVALSSIRMQDFLRKKRNWSNPIIISPPGMDDKDAALFPKKIGGKFAFLHRLGLSIWIDLVPSLTFDGTRWLGGQILMNPREGEHDSQKIGIAGPPIETAWGWLLLYHGISRGPARHYHLRAALLDLNDPTKVIARTRDPILEPDMSYEKEGLVSDVVFSCGAVVVNDTLLVYYGGADKVLAVATAPFKEFMKRVLAEK